MASASRRAPVHGRGAPWRAWPVLRPPGRTFSRRSPPCQTLAARVRRPERLSSHRKRSPVEAHSFPRTRPCRPARGSRRVRRIPTRYGGVWFPTHQPPIMWRLPFPPEVRRELITRDHRHGSLSISDLELAATVALALPTVAECPCGSPATTALP